MNSKNLSILRFYQITKKIQLLQSKKTEKVSKNTQQSVNQTYQLFIQKEQKNIHRLITFKFAQRSVPTNSTLTINFMKISQRAT